MPIELHERLSEFSYGYGVTRETERRLRAAGLEVTPFLPSVLHEAELGFDVGFNRPGRPLLLQFKLGQAMQRFRPAPRPPLEDGFWRFRVDTAEPDGQYELLLKAEQDGAQVVYVSPKFHDWEIYLGHYEANRVLAQSLIVAPSAIRDALEATGQPDGRHRIVYDRRSAYACSKPAPLESLTPVGLDETLVREVREGGETLAASLRRVHAGFDRRDMIRRPDQAEHKQRSERLMYAIPSESGRQPGLRARRLERLRIRAPSEEAAFALAVGAEAWALGAQLVMVRAKN
ncbi:hypothetical protein [Brevundimonas lutea]|uniref:hypothetical protein n=1 Tax=Brevundimonas lutea TaxID=2293980 RepID=UPI000F02EE8C|nr:hypothetical protein [Brevundimonas lutea]